MLKTDKEMFVVTEFDKIFFIGTHFIIVKNL